jgi:hypothetical protein
MKLKLNTQEKADFRIERAQFEGTLEFFADLNVAVAIPESESVQDTAMIAVFASKTSMSKTFAMQAALYVTSDYSQMLTVLRKDRTDSEIARDMAEVFSLVEPEALSCQMISDAVSDSRLGDRWDDKQRGDRWSFDR